MVRMTNVGLLPGTDSMASMIAATDDGILMDTNRSWSIDDKRLNFQFGCEIGWEIKGGKLGRMLRNPTYTGDQPALLGRARHARRTRRVDRSGGRRTAARASRSRSATPAIRRSRPGSAGSGWGCAGERRRSPGERRADDASPSESSTLVKARAAGAEAEVTVRSGTAALTRFANSFIHQNVAEELSQIALRVALDGHVAVVSLDGPPDDDALGRLVDGALEAARVSPPDPDWPGLAPRAAAPDVDHWDDATAEADPDDRAEIVAAFVAAAGGLETAGACATDAGPRRVREQRRPGA